MRNRRRRIRRRRGCAPRIFVLFAILLTLGFGVYAMVANNDEDYINEEAEDYYIPDEYTQAYEEDALIPSLPLTPISTHQIIDTGYLALVNHNHPAPAEPDPALIAQAWPTVAVSRIDDMFLHQSALRAVSEMFTSARELDAGAFFVSSGFRDFYRQAYLYGDGGNSDYIMPPGFSEHHTGLAADILVVGIGMHELADTTEGRWMAANSYRYGLILRYPEGTQHITGIAFEPWHLRYVGRIHAYYMMQNNFVLEEYIDYIHNRGYFSFEKNGYTHYIFHQVPEGGMIYVPEGLDFVASSDNKGGYIIWTTLS